MHRSRIYNKYGGNKITFYYYISTILNFLNIKFIVNDQYFKLSLPYYIYMDSQRR